MHSLEGRDFFNNIRRYVKISHFVASIIPVALLVYFSLRYVYPYVTDGDISRVPVNIGILLFLAVSVSVLGLILTTKATNSSISSAQELNNKLNSLFGITKQFRETIYLDILLNTIMKSAIELTAAESGFLLLRDEEGSLRYMVSAGSNINIKKNAVLNAPGSVAARVAENGMPAVINDAAKDSRFSFESFPDNGHAVSSILSVPLIYAKETIGVIELHSTHKGMFTEKDQALLHSLADQASISIVHNRTSERQQSDLIHITEMLVNAQDYIQNKRGHARRVAHYANHIGKHLNFEEKELKTLYYASLLHDIGMLKIDTEDQKDREKIVHHPRLGYDLIRSISLWGESANIILHHHERYDGTGYPLGKKGDEIPIGSRILHAADTFDVLTSSYSYRETLDYSSAMNEMEMNSGTQFDPQVVTALKASITEAGLMRQ